MKYTLVNSEIKDNYIKQLLSDYEIKEIENFLSPTEDSLQSWEDLINIDSGIQKVKETINDNSSYAIIADCDCDGITSFAILYQYLKRLNPNKQIDFYIHEGKQHGLEDIHKQLLDKEYSIVFCPDSGSNDGIYAKLLNTSVIVIDHHILEDTSEFPKNMIIINNQNSPNYHNKNLSGAGMVWQFCRGLDFYYGNNWAYDYIDLAAVGICGDMMSGKEIENQYIWKVGFSNIRNFFLKSIIEKQSYSMNGKINPTTIAFYIVPLINAMIRVGTQEEKRRLYSAFIDGEKLIESNKRGAKGTLEKAAIESIRECTNAKAKQNRLLDAAVEKMEIKIHKYDLLENKVIIIKLDEEDSFPSELNGLLAMKISAKYKKPTLVLRENKDGILKGSARGVNNGPLVSLKNYLSSTGLFDYCTGHDEAFGAAIDKRKLEQFYNISNEELKDLSFGEDCFEVNFIRAAADRDIADIIFEVNKYEDIWSQGVAEPRLYIHDININKSDIQIMGKNKDTVKFNKFGVDYIKFHAEDFINDIQQYNEIKLEIVGKGNINEWMGNTSPQILIEGYEVSDGSLSF